MSKKNNKPETSTHVYTRDASPNDIFYQNYDLYGPKDGGKTGPGTGFYGVMSEKEKEYGSVSEFLEKKRKSKKRKQALTSMYERVKQSKKKVVKLAVIRSDNEAICPFGLDIPESCNSTGTAILEMTPFEDLDDKLIENNKRIYINSADGKKCPFAREVFENAVQCSFSLDNQTHPPVGSPYYYRHFNHETSIDGLYSYPTGSGSLGYYAESAIPTDNYNGPYSIESISSNKDERKK